MSLIILHATCGHIRPSVLLRNLKLTVIKKFQIQMPKQILSDRNEGFTSSSFQRFLQNCNVKHLFNSPNHTETKEMFKESIKKL